MRRRVVRTWLATLAAALLWAGPAGAEATVKVTREQNTPATVVITVGDEVRWVNQSGGVAHVWFGGDDAIRLYVGRGGSRVRFDKPGTYDYTVHVSGTKVHAHTGTVVVK